MPTLLLWMWFGATAVTTVATTRRASGRDLLAAVLLVALTAQVFWSFYVWWGGQDPTRAQVGTFYAPNQYAGYVLLLAPLGLALCLLARSRITAAGAGFVTSFSYLGILLSGSRAGALGAAVGALVVVAWAARVRFCQTLMRSAVVLIFLLALGAVMTSTIFFPHTRSTPGVSGVLAVKGADTTDLVQRWHWDLGALEIGLQRPLVGSGLGTFGDMFSMIQKPTWQWSRWAHNQYLEAFAEGGVPLFLAMLAIPVLFLIGGWQVLRTGVTPNAYWRIGLFGGLLGSSLHLLVDHDWSYPGFAVTFVVAGFLLISQDGEFGPASSGARAGRWALAAVAVACLASVVAQHVSTRLLARSPSEATARWAARLAPYSSAPYQQLGLLEAADGTPSALRRAAQSFQGAIARDHLDLSARWELAAVDGRLGKLASARAQYRQAIRVSPVVASPYLAAAGFEVQSGDHARAREILDEGIGKLRQAPASAHSSGLLQLLAAEAALSG